MTKDKSQIIFKLSHPQ